MRTVPARAVRMDGFRFGVDDLNFPAAETQRVFHSLGHSCARLCCDGHAVLDHLHHGGESLHLLRLIGANDHPVHPHSEVALLF